MADEANSPPKRIKVKLWIYVKNGGDGSCSTSLFSSEEAAEKYAEPDDERYQEDIQQETFEVDENGNLLTPDPVRDDD
jgi:hypothetical protein